MGPTAAAGYAKALLDFAVAKGAGRAQLLERAGISAADLDDADHRVPFEKFKALVRAAKELSRDPALALHFGAATDMSEFSIVGLIADAAETMAHALQQLNRYGQLVVEVDLGATERFRNVRDDKGMWLIDFRQNPNDFPELTESTFARMACHSRRFGTDDQPFVKGAHVTHPAPSYHAEYERILRAPVTFGSDRNGLLIDASWINRKVARTTRYAFGILSRRATEMLEALERSQTMRGQVESRLIPLLHAGPPNIEQVAEGLGVSRKTLYRNLKAEGVTFEKLLDELRHKMALHYLDGKKVSVNEAAYLVGFSDRSAFTRAFKRWTGTTPGTKRQR